MSFQPRIFTFYSYKGGVGRSMALLNMAYYLQARGRHVLIVDLDLEAPGASGFLHRSEELLPESTKDVVDVLAKVVGAVRLAPAGTLPDLPELRLSDYLRSVDPQKYATAVHPRAPRARLDVLGAEQGPDYTARFSELGLPALSAQQVGDASDLLRGLLIQHSFPFPQPWQEEGAAPEPTRYDYILVDSRTGLSEIGGLCIGPLSDRLIVLCGLNDQNIEGTRQFMEVVGLKPEVRPADTEAYDDADPPAEDGLRPVTLGPKPTLLVASPVPGGEMIYKKQRMKVMKEQLGMTPVKLSYHPHMALMETIFVRDYEDEYLAMEYATLAQRVMSMVGDTVQQLMSPVHRFLTDRFSEDEAKSTGTVAGAELRLLPPRNSKRMKEEEKPDAKDLLQRVARSALADGQNDFDLPPFMITRLDLSAEARANFWQLRINLAQTDALAAQRWLEWADDMNTEAARKTGSIADFRAMDDKYRKAVTLVPQFHQAFYNWGIALADWADIKAGAEADALFAQACEKYQQAVAIDKNDEFAFGRWGITLADWANIKAGTEADALFAQACEMYQQAITINPKNYRSFVMYGVALSNWAGSKAGEETETLLNQACEKYQQATAIEKNDNFPFCRWGMALSERAKTKAGTEADTLCALACEKYQQAAAIDKNDDFTFLRWGDVLLDWAKTKEGAEADALFAQACEKYQQAAVINTNDDYTFCIWGSALSDWAKTKEGAEADALFAKACEKYQEAAVIDKNVDFTLRTWGDTLSDWADTKEAAEADSLFAQACEKYQQATAIDKNDDFTFCRWGITLSEWANTKEGAEADALFAQAIEKFQQAAVIDKNDAFTLRKWGMALSDWAKIKAGAEADALLVQACEKYQQVVSIDENDNFTLYRWGSDLLQWAKTKEGAEADALLTQAGEKFEKLILIQPDHRASLYNLGCVAALRSKAEEAVTTLEKWKSSDPEANKAKLDEDSDFDLIRNDPRFQAFRDGLAG
jgi:tetratricopeptide (TPR) repeat protein